MNELGIKVTKNGVDITNTEFVIPAGKGVIIKLTNDPNIKNYGIFVPTNLADRGPTAEEIMRRVKHGECT